MKTTNGAQGKHPAWSAWILFFGCIATAFGAEASDADISPMQHTSSDVVLLLVYILLALVFSFLCSIAEAVILSITPAYIAGLRDTKPKLAKLLKQLKQDNVDQSLAAILTLNTIAHTVGAIGAGAKATAVFGSTWFGLFSALMTLMILFLSEIIPKTLGAVYWRNLAGLCAVFVRGLIVSLYPLIKISQSLTQLVARKKNLHVFSRDEFIAMARVGEQHGQIDSDESRIIRNLFRLDSLTTEDIMTPRTVIFALDQELTVTQALSANPNITFSRIPLFTDDLDNIGGFILKSDLFLQKAQCRDDTQLKDLLRKLGSVRYDMPLSGLLELLLDKRQHIALVVDEYGSTRGLVTLEDVVETLLGMEIVDETDKVEDMQALARQQWVHRAKALGIEVETPEQNQTGALPNQQDPPATRNDESNSDRD